MATITIGRTLSSTTDSVRADQGAPGAAWPVANVTQLVPEAFDHMDLGYTGSNLTSVTYRTGGASGTVVATLAIAYTGANITSVTRT